MKRFHERGNRFIQVDRRGDWHGYIVFVYAGSFCNEGEALQWLVGRTQQQENTPI